MTSQWVLIIVCTTCGLFGIVGAARTYFRRPPSPDEFGNLFFRGWGSAGMLAMGTLTLMQLLPLGMGPGYACVVFVGLMGFLALAYPASWLATRWYQRATLQTDYVEDASENSVPGSAPEAPGYETIETWEDLIRAQRRLTGKHAGS
jgi:hypothetical protein